ncbi:peptide chain release factor N(5)-glutamine methyltransferase [Hornefia butyriciproducens]|uniref:peptide chain release factor N(5)-glutamine methyltransferase n=1 Tax=Hornefia butyriciproducens TaxID=2652293 RepID=UPI002A91F306|nr:peptide chain release factor N(5)-glutamine methyltransferase [Hornefia butyriciproducens]MCI7412592.1 peptide chain release factor N(5)-glutamine methyltransferase [Clostridiales bacterium]MDY6211930.1 peptide chain release factor N(5)-glutamine methyltransferase [Hornefia butyriciproducens]
MRKGRAMTARELINKGAQELAERGVADAETDSRLLFCHLAGVSRSRLFMEYPRMMTDTEIAAYKALIRRRGTGEPLQYIVGETEFMGLRFRVDSRVLIPRPETELLVEKALELLKGFSTKSEQGSPSASGELVAATRQNPLGSRQPVRILDCCCGSGAIGLSVAALAEMPVRVSCSDISPDALEVARRNAGELGFFGSFGDGRRGSVEFLCGSFLEPAAGRQFDMILCNPPYIQDGVIPGLQREVREHEPLLALAGGADGMDSYREMIPRLTEHLTDGGVAMFEIGHDQGEAVANMFAETGEFGPAQVMRDLAGRNRIVWTRRRYPQSAV